MQIKLSTSKLKDMVSKAVKGAANNKMIPITGLMAVELNKNVLTITTTDATNTLKIIEKKVEGDDFYVTVQVDIFSKLVSKTTSESITLTLEDNILTFKGNGKYTIELPLNEEQELIKFPDYKFNTKAKKSEVNLSTIKHILRSNKAALAETMEVPVLTGYYFDEETVLSTDSFKVCGNEVGTLGSKVLIPSELLELLALMEDEKVKFQKDGKKLLFTTDNVTVFGYELEGVADYPVDAIKQYIQTEFKSMCKLPKSALLDVIDRLSLFVSAYDKNGIFLTFSKDGLIISSKKSNGTELIEYRESKEFEAFTCCIDIELFKTQLQAQDTDEVELWYGHESAIKMVFGKTTQIVALLEDEREEEDGSEGA